MADPVSEAISQIKGLLANVEGVGVLHIYDQDDLLDQKFKLGFPALGIVYAGLRASEKGLSTRTPRGAQGSSALKGLTADLLINLYYIGGKQCEDRMSQGGLTIETVAVLDAIRNAIKCNDFTGFSGGQRVWEFVFEAPTVYETEKTQFVAYVQQWRTRVILSHPGCGECP